VSKIYLTPRQREISLLLMEGLSDKMIARKLSVSERTVHFHVANLRTIFGVNSRLEVAARLFANGIPPERDLRCRS